MKTLLLTAVLASAASVAFAQDFSAAQRRYPQATRTPLTQRIVREGGLQHAARTGNALHALNPFAPAEYGTGAEFVENRHYDPGIHPRDPGREQPIALRLFAFEF